MAEHAGFGDRATGQISRPRILELMRTRCSPSAARAAFERAIEGADLPEKTFYSPPEVERIADEFALRPLDRGNLIALLLQREAAAAAAAIGMGREPDGGTRNGRRRQSAFSR